MYNKKHHQKNFERQVGTAIGLIVTGQIICAVTIDHFSLFNVAVRSISLTRAVGMLLMAAGIYLVLKK